MTSDSFGNSKLYPLKSENTQAVETALTSLGLLGIEIPAALVSAEIARIEGRDLEAMRLFDEAIRAARENGFVQNEGIAYELATRFYAGRGFDLIAEAYLRKARYCYLRWGAAAKVRQFDEL